MKSNSVYVVGGGASLVGFDWDKLRNENTIAVNKSFSYVPNLDYFLTMDFTVLKKSGMEGLGENPATKVFIANFGKPYLKEFGGRIMDTRSNLVYRLSGFDVIIKSYTEHGISRRWNGFRSGNNSGFSGLQLAVLLGYAEIHLLGIDLVVSGDTHFHEGYHSHPVEFQKRLDEYYENWVLGITTLHRTRNDITIYSGSKISRLNKIIPYLEV